VDHVSSGISGKRSDFATYYGHRNMVWTYVKNMPTPLLWFYLPQHLLVNLLAIGVCAARGQLRTILRAKRDALLGIGRVLKDRELTQSTSTIGWRELRSSMSRGLGALWGRQ
jgi:hypothetical protein